MQAFRLPEMVDLLHGKPATVCQRYAVAELSRLLGRIGVKAAAHEEGGDSGTVWIVLRASGSRERVSLPSLDLVRADGYALRVATSGVALTARSANARGRLCIARRDFGRGAHGSLGQGAFERCL